MSKQSHWKTWLLRAVMVVVIVGVTIAGVLIYQGVMISIRGEHALHATLLTFALVDDYVKANDGAWPNSWSDLEAMPPREWAMFDWPRDSEQVQEHVAIEFAADPAKLARQSAEEFEAIRPIPPCYPYKDYGKVQSLFKTLAERRKD